MSDKINAVIVREGTRIMARISTPASGDLYSIEAIETLLAEMRRHQVEFDNRPAAYVTTYCNHAHRLTDGKPVAHNCYILPPAALLAERDGDTDRAIELLQKAKPLTEHRGVKG